MPTDDYGSSSDTAHNLGQITSQQSISGLIGTLSDKDYFTFTAGASATIDVTFSTTHGLEPDVTLVGGGGTFADGTLSFDVVTGQNYTISLQTAAGHGIGYYSAEFTLEESFDQPLQIVKSITAADGRVYSLDSEDWLSIDGYRVWEKTRDFALSSDGTLHWLSTGGMLARRLSNGSWQELDRDTTKFAISNDGTVYSLGADGWVNLNGERVWQDTADFAIGPDGTILWQSISGTLHRRSAQGEWSLVDSHVTKFAVGCDGVAYALRSDNWISVNGTSVWENSRDFVLAEDQSLYWQSTRGSLYRLPNAESWQLVKRDVSQFAVCQDGTVYTLTGDKDVFVNGSRTWSDVHGMRTDQWGRLRLERSDGSVQIIEGRFATGSYRNETSNSPGLQAVGSAGKKDAAASSALSADIAFEAVGSRTIEGSLLPHFFTESQPEHGMKERRGFGGRTGSPEPRAVENEHLSLLKSSHPAQENKDRFASIDRIDLGAFDVAIWDIDAARPLNAELPDKGVNAVDDLFGQLGR